MKKYLNIREIQLEENNILKETVIFLEKHNLRYYLIGGTLLGAIRHKGFIPWDDDIDIGMFRSDYEKLIQLSKKEAISDDLEIKAFELQNLNYPYGKVINKNILLDNINREDNNLWIDIFPIDFVPNDKKIVSRLYRKNKFYRYLLSARIYKISTFFQKGGNLKKNIIKLIVKIISLVHSPYYYSKKIVNNTINTCVKESNSLGVVVWGYGPQEIINIDDTEIIKVEFENNKYNGFKNYDKYLSNIYGEYMNIPKEKDRQNHVMKVIKNEKR